MQQAARRPAEAEAAPRGSGRRLGCGGLKQEGEEEAAARWRGLVGRRAAEAPGEGDIAVAAGMGDLEGEGMRGKVLEREIGRAHV